MGQLLLELELASQRPLELAELQLELAMEQPRLFPIELLHWPFQVSSHVLNFLFHELILFSDHLYLGFHLFGIVRGGYGHYFGEREHRFGENERQREFRLAFMILSANLFFQL
jgi:hypothetical protein